jgi:hypothetical protein
MAITSEQIAKLAQRHAADFAEKVDIQFLVEYYISDYLHAYMDDIETIIFDIYNHNNQNTELTKNFLIESGINVGDAEDILNYWTTKKDIGVVSF